MTKEELREIREQIEFMGRDWFFYANGLRLLDEVELKESEYQATITKLNTVVKVCQEAQKENESLRKQVEFNRKYGIHSNAMKEIERLQKILDQWHSLDKKIRQMFIDNFHLGESRITVADYFQLQLDMGMIEINCDCDAQECECNDISYGDV